MQQHMSLDELTELRGEPVYDTAGEKIGSVEEIFYDHETGEPEWIGIGTGFFGTKRVLVPLAGASATEDGITVRYGKDQVKDSPDVDSDEISQERERELYAYYGLEASKRRSDSVLPESGGKGRSTREAARGGRDEEAAVTRTEEELHVGKERVETGGIRLRKWVETERVDVPVELRKEKVAVQREPLDREASPEEIGEDEIEVTISEERPVVEKRAVAKERISVDKDVETERETVGDEVRKERVDVDDTTRSSRKR